MPSYLIRSRPTGVAGRRQACHCRNHEVGERPRRLPDLEERLADVLIDGDPWPRIRLGQRIAQDRRIDFVGQDDAQLHQKDVKPDLEERGKIGARRHGETRHESQLGDHHPEGRDEHSAQQHDRLARDDREKIDSRSEDRRSRSRTEGSR